MRTLNTIVGSVALILASSSVSVKALELFTAPIPILSHNDTITCSAVNVSSAAITITVSFLDAPSNGPFNSGSCTVTPGPLTSQACSFSLRAREIGQGISPFRCEFSGTGAIVASICAQHATSDAQHATSDAQHATSDTQHATSEMSCLPAFPSP